MASQNHSGPSEKHETHSEENLYSTEDEQNLVSINQSKFL